MVQAGTRMTAAEYATLPETTQPMELIHGEIVVSPTPRLNHRRIVFEVASLLRAISRADEAIQGEVVISPMDVHLDEDTVLQPDVFWVSPTNTTCHLKGDGHVKGAPDLVVEVLSPGTAVRDKTTKFELYQQAGVREYWIVEATYIEVYRLADGTFERVGVYEAGQTFASAVLGGHEIVVGEIF